METAKSSNGIGFIGLLQIVFIVLKLCKIIEWSWWEVMLPFEICALIFILAIVSLFFIRWYAKYSHNKLRK